MATVPSFLHHIKILLLPSLNPLMYSLLFCSLVILSLLSLVFAALFLLKISRRTTVYREKPSYESNLRPEPEAEGFSEILERAQKQTRKNDATRLEDLFEFLPSARDGSGGGGDPGVSGKKKRRGKKKKSDPKSEEHEHDLGDKPAERDDSVSGSGSGSGIKPELICLYPFTSTGSATQRRIKQQYDHLVKCNETKGLTLAQVGEFANCLVEARKELQHKSEVIKRKFTITKALLLKADRSSFDRLRQQIYKIEMEQKRLDEDVFVYNWLQQQLKLSPAYKKMLEISAGMELKEKSEAELESPDDDSSDISFEELLAQEKKDSFWQKKGRLRTCKNR